VIPPRRDPASASQCRDS